MRRLLQGVSALLLLSGCQAILGFEELTPAEGGGGSQGSGDGKGTSGVACAKEADCLEDLACLYGYCRPACLDDTYCEQGSVCLWGDDGFGGCRLARESCEEDACENADLVCGLDGTCRVACSDVSSCEAPTQRCVAGTCVSTVGEDVTTWDCGGVDDGQISCNEGVLSVCNGTAPGLAEIDDCGSTALCENSLPADTSYDPNAPPECAAGCTAGQPYCDGATLLLCEDDGSGPVDAGETCNTEKLCAAAVTAAASACPSSVCAADETRCSGGETELVAERCADGLDDFEPADFCDTQELQCNPATGACLELSIDATEVTMATYTAWLATTPTTAGQPEACELNTSFAPNTDCMMATEAPDCTNCEQPVVCIDWCDAYAYCQAKGQHLCGKIGGGMNPYDRYDDAGSSEWMNACSAGGQFEYGSGAAPVASAEECAHSGSQLDASYAVKSRANCHSPSPGYQSVFDMSGNVAEWEDSCEKSAQAGDANDACRTRGGSIKDERDDTQCAAVPASALVRGTVSPTVGFRCCG